MATRLTNPFEVAKGLISLMAQSVTTSERTVVAVCGLFCMCVGVCMGMCVGVFLRVVQ